jgi:solute:Na+ symporter, SSS family
MSRLGLKIFSGNIDPEGIIYKVFLAPNWLHYEIALFFIVVIIIIAVSFFTEKASEEKLAGLTFFSTSAEQKRVTRESWNRWDIIHTVIILGVVVAFYIYFW